MAMKNVTGLRVAPFAVLVVLLLLAYLAVHREAMTLERAEDEAMDVPADVVKNVGRDKYVAVAIVGVIALFAFVIWTALRARAREDEATPQARESNLSDKTASR
jgi:hypothetical protein